MQNPGKPVFSGFGNKHLVIQSALFVAIRSELLQKPYLIKQLYAILHRMLLKCAKRQSPFYLGSKMLWYSFPRNMWSGPQLICSSGIHTEDRFLVCCLPNVYRLQNRDEDPLFTYGLNESQVQPVRKNPLSNMSFWKVLPRIFTTNYITSGAEGFRTLRTLKTLAITFVLK